MRNEDEVFGQLAVLLAALLDALASDSERVVLQALSVLGAIAGHAQHFRRVLMSLLDRWVPSIGCEKRSTWLFARRVLMSLADRWVS